MSTKAKTAEEIATLLGKFATGLEDHVEDHPALRPLIGQISRKATSLTKPAKEAKAVQLSYESGQIYIKDTPYLHPGAFGAWRFKLAECKGEETGTRVNNEGDTVPTYASTYDKELGMNVMPEDKKDELLAVIKSFFPDSPIQEVTASAAN